MILTFQNYYKSKNIQEEGLKGALAGAAMGLSSLMPMKGETKVNFEMPRQAQTVTPVALSKTSEDDLLAATLVLEGRGEGIKGMQAILEVILNRAKQGRKTTSQIVLAPKQFSCFNNIKNINEYVKQVKQKHSKSFDLAKQIVNAAKTNHTKGALWYHTLKVAPSWGRELVKRGAKKIIIGNHVFYHF